MNIIMSIRDWYIMMGETAKAWYAANPMVYLMIASSGASLGFILSYFATAIVDLYIESKAEEEEVTK